MDIKTSAEGKIGKINVSVGDVVEKGTELFQVEGGKNNTAIKAKAKMKITGILAEEGKEVAKDESVMTAEELSEEVKVLAEEEGKVCRIAVSVGDKVEKGTVLAEVEGGKNNKIYKAPVGGTVSAVSVSEGETAAKGAELFAIVTDGEAEEKDFHTQLLIIGGGPGGYVAAIYAAKNGLKTTLVEKANLGGTCLNVGCIPTKALVKSSEICHNVNHALDFGIIAEKAVPDMNKIIDRKNNVVHQLVSGIDGLMDKNSVNVLRGSASFLSDKEVLVKDKEGVEHKITFDDVIIATGSNISKIVIPGIELPFVLNSTTALDNRVLPESITIIGGGVIGLEFAFLYRNLGVEVTVVEFMDRLLPMVDRDISEEICKIALKKGIRVELSSRVTKFEEADGKAVTTFEKDGAEVSIESEKVLVAIGRNPNLEGLCIEKTSVELNERGRGIKVDNGMRTNVEHIYAIGDVNNIIQLAHAASHQGIIAVDNIMGKNHEFNKINVPSVTFTSPEIANVGWGEDELKAAGRKYTVGRFDYISNGKALTMNETEGYIKLIKDENDYVIGCSIIGADASSLIAAVTVAIANGLKDSEIRSTIFAHPTTGEVIHEAAMGLGIGTLHQ